MPDRKTVALGLQYCVESVESAECSENCPYYDSCWGETSEMYEDLLKDSLAILQPQPARLLTLDEAQTATGHGWEESWIYETDENPETIDLFECVFIHSHIRLDDGDISEVRPDRYGKKYHSRLWMGDIPPTDEQRKAAPWQ